MQQQKRNSLSQLQNFSAVNTKTGKNKTELKERKDEEEMQSYFAFFTSHFW